MLEIPSLLANNEDKVLFPVPEAPPNKTMTDLRFEITSHAILKSFKWESPLYPWDSKACRAMLSKIVFVSVNAGIHW